MNVQRPTVSVVIPVYNSQETLPSLVAALVEILPACTSEFEIVLVNDGSADGSWELIQQISKACPNVRGINLMRNYGQHNALLCGIRSARNEVIVTLDDDLQNPPSEIPRLLQKLSEGYDVVYGAPATQQHGLLRNVASLLTKLALQSAMGVETARKVSPFRAFRTKVREAFDHYRGAFVSIDVLLTWGTRRFVAISVKHEERRSGRSNYNLHKLLRHAWNMITGFTTLPLEIASFIGFGFTLFGVCVLVYVLARYFIQGGSVPGFPFLASIIAIFAGVQIFVLGVIGEYIARIHLRSMERPPYVVRTDSIHEQQQSNEQIHS